MAEGGTLVDQICESHGDAILEILVDERREQAKRDRLRQARDATAEMH
jgi:hypothetical protein